MIHLQGIVFITVLCVVNAAVVVKIYDDDASAKPNIKDCNYMECAQQCRRIGFPGGACVGDRCKCDIIQQERSKISTIQDLRGCNSNICNQLCRRMGFTGGSCANNYCQCDGFKLKDFALMNDVGDCYYPDCDSNCRSRGYFGGYCWGDNCNCFNFNQTNIDVITNIEKNSNDIVLSNKIDECSRYQCKMSCQLQGYLGGSCINDECKCHKKENKIRKELEACDDVTCNLYCKNMNSWGGFCLSDYCICL